MLIVRMYDVETVANTPECLYHEMFESKGVSSIQ